MRGTVTMRETKRVAVEKNNVVPEMDTLMSSQINSSRGHVTEPNLRHACAADLHKLFHLFPPGATTSR